MQEDMKKKQNQQERGSQRFKQSPGGEKTED